MLCYSPAHAQEGLYKVFTITSHEALEPDLFVLQIPYL